MVGPPSRTGKEAVAPDETAARADPDRSPAPRRFWGWRGATTAWVAWGGALATTVAVALVGASVRVPATVSWRRGALGPVRRQWRGAPWSAPTGEARRRPRHGDGRGTTATREDQWGATATGEVGSGWQ